MASLFALVVGGALIGWFVRDNSKTHDAETDARIKDENAEYAERIRREHEAHEAEKAAFCIALVKVVRL